MDESQLNKKYPQFSMEKMIDYLENELSSEEIEEMDRQLKNDPIFAQAMSELEQFHFGHENAREDALRYKEVFNSETDKLAAEKQENVGYNWKKIAAVALMIVIPLLLLFYFLGSNKETSAEELFASYYEPYPDVISVRENLEGSDDLLTGLTHYNNKNYEEAIKYLSSSPASTQSEKSTFYLAQSYLASGQISSALASFEKLSESSSIFRPHAEWYLGLIHLKIGEEYTAIHYFMRVANNEDGYNRTQAKEILEDIFKKNQH